MNLTRCENGHFYDQDKFDYCPHCKSGAGAMKTLPLDDLDDPEKTLPLEGLDAPEKTLPIYGWDDGPTVPISEEEKRENYLRKRNLLHCIDRDYTITVNVVTESGKFEKSVQLTVKGGDTAGDVLQNLKKRGEIASGRKYSFVNWPTVSPWGCLANQSKYVCELCEECKPQRFVVLLKRIGIERMVCLYGCPNAASIDYSGLRERLSVEIIEYEN